MQAREDEIVLVRDRQRSVGTLLLETWLDDVLTARSPDDGVALDLLHAAPVVKRGLIAFGVDRDALAGAGVANAAIDRIYRGMYVYSVGFSDLLRVRLRLQLAVVPAQVKVAGAHRAHCNVLQLACVLHTLG
jgi:hypothetical protein